MKLTENVSKYEDMVRQYEHIKSTAIYRDTNNNLSIIYQEPLKGFGGDLLENTYLKRVVSEYFEVMLDKAIRDFEYDIERQKDLIKEEIIMLENRLSE